MNMFLKVSALAAAGLTFAAAVPATAAVSYTSDLGSASTFVAPGEQTFNQYRDYYRNRDYRRGYRNNYRYRERSWRGNNRRYSCRRGSGTTGLVLGGAGGALLGREIDGGRDRTLGTILGAAGGALLGREIDRGGRRC